MGVVVMTVAAVVMVADVKYAELTNYSDTVYECGCGSGSGSASKELLIFQGSTGCSDQAIVFACIYADTGCGYGSMSNYRSGIEVDDPNLDYWSSDFSCTYASFVWTRPANTTNAEVERRDFTFTFMVYADTNNNGRHDQGEAIIDSAELYVHVGYAEVIGWVHQPDPNDSTAQIAPDPNFPDDPTRVCVGHGSWEIVVDPGSISHLKSKASSEQIALLDTYANQKWGWGAVNENYIQDASNPWEAMNNFTPGMLRCDDDYETRYDPDPEDDHDIRYPYDTKMGWTISISGLYNVLEFTRDIPETNEHLYHKDMLLATSVATRTIRLGIKLPEYCAGTGISGDMC